MYITRTITEVTPHIISRRECRLPLVEYRADGKNIPRFITIHETSTGLEKTPAYKDASHYIDLLEHPKSDPRIGYHFLCSDTEVIQLLETWSRTAHTGSTAGNSSIGIERLVNEEVSYDIAIENQARLTATLMHMYNIPIGNVVPHNTRSSEECPSRLLAGAYGWDWRRFIKLVYAYYCSSNIIRGIDENLPSFVYDFLEESKRDLEER